MTKLIFNAEDFDMQMCAAEARWIISELKRAWKQNAELVEALEYICKTRDQVTEAIQDWRDDGLSFITLENRIFDMKHTYLQVAISALEKVKGEK